MKALGEIFQTRRKELNLSLKEVENSTSIRLPYLQAIEEGQMDKLISPIYAQGFVKQYATATNKRFYVGKRFVVFREVFRHPIFDVPFTSVAFNGWSD